MHHRGIITFVSGIILLLSPRAHALTFWAPATKDTIQLMSLRGAIIAANAIGGNNTILLGPSLSPHARKAQPWVYHLTLQGANEDQAKTGDLDITRGHLTIIGITSNVVIDATGLGDRVFQVFPNASLTLENVTITGGIAPLANSVYFDNFDNIALPSGGGILNYGTLKMNNCLVHGNTSANGSEIFGTAIAGGSGGGIFNAGHAEIMNCKIVANVTGGATLPYLPELAGDGGGIYNVGTILLTNCEIASNSCGLSGNIGFLDGIIYLNPTNPPGVMGGGGGRGGGAFNTGIMEIESSTLDENKAGDGGYGVGGAGGVGGNGGNGGGFFNTGILTLNTCTLSGNSAGNGGAGADGLNSTGADGGNGGNGGGIYNLGTLHLTSCNIALNQAGTGGNAGSAEPLQYVPSPAGNGGNGGNGGGIFSASYGTNVIMRNSIIALNIPNVGGSPGTNFLAYSSNILIGTTGSTGIGYEINGAYTSQGFNLISTGDGGTGFTNGVNSDQVGTDDSPINPVLGPLQWNGGPTLTHALLPGSPAINQGFSFGLHVDQRGYRRPSPYPGIPNTPNGDGSDIGAFELQGR